MHSVSQTALILYKKFRNVNWESFVLGVKSLHQLRHKTQNHNIAQLGSSPSNHLHSGPTSDYRDEDTEAEEGKLAFP